MSGLSLFIRPFLQARCGAAACPQRARLTRLRSFAPRTGFNILTSKRGNQQFYKGKGGRSLGRHTKLGASLSGSPAAQGLRRPRRVQAATACSTGSCPSTSCRT